MVRRRPLLVEVIDGPDNKCAASSPRPHRHRQHHDCAFRHRSHVSATLKIALVAPDTIRDLDSQRHFIDRSASPSDHRPRHKRASGDPLRVTPSTPPWCCPAPKNRSASPRQKPAMRRVFGGRARRRRRSPCAPRRVGHRQGGRGARAESLAARRWPLASALRRLARRHRERALRPRARRFQRRDRDRVGAFEAARGAPVPDAIGECARAQTRRRGHREPPGAAARRQEAARRRAPSRGHQPRREQRERGAFRGIYFRRRWPSRAARASVTGHALYRRAAGRTPIHRLARDPRAPRAAECRERPRDRNFLERRASADAEAPPASTRPRPDAPAPYKLAKARLLEEFERGYVTDLLARHDGNITHAARAAEIDRVYLLRLLDKFGLRKKP